LFKIDPFFLTSCFNQIPGSEKDQSPFASAFYGIAGGLQRLRKIIPAWF